MKAIKYPSINGLRAISILMVIFGHLAVQYNIFVQAENIMILKPIIGLLKDAGLGVNVFFVISGFLITSLMQTEELNTNTVSLKDFYIRRTLRIFPAYFFLLFVYFILQCIDYLHISSMGWITALTYTKYFYKEDWYTAHAWSLSVEEHFYLFWPLMFLGGDKFRKIAAMVLIMIVPCVRVFTHLHPVAWIYETSIFTRIDSIAIGCLFALYKENIISVLQKYWKLIFAISLILLLFLRNIGAILASKLHLNMLVIALGLNHGHGTVANLLIAVIMMYSIYHTSGLWFKFLNWKVMEFIGILSYSIYLWQQIFTEKSENWVTHPPQNLFFILGAALFSYYIVEKPFLRLKNRFSKI